MTTLPRNPLHALGSTRSRRGMDHLLQTPDTFVWAALPGMQGAAACIHAAPQIGAAFAQYSVRFEEGGSWASTSEASRFVYVLSGSLHAEGESPAALEPHDYLYAPPGKALHLSTAVEARLVVIEKPYVHLDGVATPAPLRGNAAQAPATALLGDPAVQVRSLLPADMQFDFAVNTMTYLPGARLSMVEVHVMEHGLLMLEGEGIYRLGDAWYPVCEGDFIWMAPFCPQWFGALGSRPASYLIYKDWNRSAQITERRP